MLLNLTTALFIFAVLFCNYRWYSIDRKTLPARTLAPWTIGGTDFYLLLWVPIMLFLFAPALLPIDTITSRLSDGEIWKNPLRMMTAHLSVIAFAVLATSYPRISIYIGKLNAKDLSSITVFRWALIFVGVMYPFIFVISLLWNGMLTLIMYLFPEVTFPDQTAINLLQETNLSLPLAVMIACIIVLAPLSEEFVFRAIVYRYLRTKYAFALAAGISGTFFAAIHFNVKTFPMLLVVGVFLAYAYERTGSLKVPIAMHMLFNGINCLFILTK